MKRELKEQFLTLWKKYIGEYELPITFYYSCAGCGTIVHYPYLESLKENPRAVTVCSTRPPDPV